MSVAQSLGMAVPWLRAAAMIEVPLGTDTVAPSMFSVTVSALWRSGVP